MGDSGSLASGYFDELSHFIFPNSGYVRRLLHGPGIEKPGCSKFGEGNASSHVRALSQEVCPIAY